MRAAKWTSSVAFVLLLVSAASAQDHSAEKRKPPKPKPDCRDGVVYDDGRFESGLKPNDRDGRGDLVMLIQAQAYPAKLNKVCLGFVAYSTLAAPNIYFDLRVWAADGEDGGPGTLLATVPVLLASRVPLRKPKFYAYDISWANIVIDGPVYIGPSWDPLANVLIHLAMDQGPRTVRHRGFYGADPYGSELKPPDQELGVGNGYIPSYRALGIRSVFGPP